MLSIHPGILLILVGLIAAACPKKIRQFLLVLGPAAAFYICMTIPKGTSLTLGFLGKYTLVYLQLTQQNYMMLLGFSLLGLIAGIFASHTDNRLESFSTMSYLGSTLGVTLAGDWLTLLVFWELMAVTSLLVIWSNRTEKSRKAGFRYLVMHMFGGNMMLFGVALKLYQGDYLISNITQTHDAAFWLILIAVCVNAAVVPLHAWAPDAYPEGSETGSVFLSFLTTKLAAFCMLQFFTGFQPLIIVGLVMIYYGGIFALIENDMKRLLSYHIISQVGFMVCDAGMGGEIGFNAGTAIAFSNVIYKPLLFMCVGAIIYATGITKINKLGGLYKKMPLLTIVFFIAAYSIAGAPPLAGFTCKSLSIVAAEETSGRVLTALLMIGSVATTLSIPFKMGYFIFFGKDRKIKCRPIPKNMSVALVLGAAVCVFVGFFPQIVYSWLPYSLDYNPYTFSHIMEYVELFPAALLPFIINIEIMEPHTALTLDFDWFARKPMKFALYGLSGILCICQRFFGNIGKTIYTFVQVLTNNPYQFFNIKPLNKVSAKNPQEHVRPDQYRVQIGMGMSTIVAMICVLAACVLAIGH